MVLPGRGMSDASSSAALCPVRAPFTCGSRSSHRFSEGGIAAPLGRTHGAGWGVLGCGHSGAATVAGPTHRACVADERRARSTEGVAGSRDPGWQMGAVRISRLEGRPQSLRSLSRGSSSGVALFQRCRGSEHRPTSPFTTAEKASCVSAHTSAQLCPVAL